MCDPIKIMKTKSQSSFTFSLRPFANPLVLLVLAQWQLICLQIVKIEVQISVSLLGFQTNFKRPICDEHICALNHDFEKVFLS